MHTKTLCRLYMSCVHAKIGMHVNMHAYMYVNLTCVHACQFNTKVTCMSTYHAAFYIHA